MKINVYFPLPLSVALYLALQRFVSAVFFDAGRVFDLCSGVISLSPPLPPSPSFAVVFAGFEGIFRYCFFVVEEIQIYVEIMIAN